MTRNPIVSGQFYASDKKKLTQDLEEMIPECACKIDAIGAVVPHAGYMYSGKVAGEVFSCLLPKETFVILSPSHTGMGARFAASRDRWITPLGEVEVDAELLDKIEERSSLIEVDPVAHAGEHSVEVEIPFIQRIAPEAKIVPITIRGGSFEEYEEVASSIASSIKSHDRSVTIIASSDMTHYEMRQRAREKDALALKAVQDIDARSLLRVVEENNISMCGCVPTAIMLLCAKELGAKESKLIKYTDSGEVTGDTLEVVGYAGVIVY